MQTRADTIKEHADTLQCRHCGKTGAVIWDQVSRAGENLPELAGIDGPFFERLSRKPPYPIELVCRACGEVAMTAYPSTALHDRGDYN